MKKKIKLILSMSLILNLVTIIILGYVFYKCNGMNTIETFLIEKDSTAFVGDSLIEKNNWGNEVSNFGRSGDTTDDIYKRIDKVIYTKPKKIFIMVGINDIGNGIKTENIIFNYKKIIDKLKSQLPKSIIYVESILPCNQDILTDELYNTNKIPESILDLNKDLKQLCLDNNLIYIDMYDSFTSDKENLNPEYTIDGVHLNDAGYNIWEDKLSTQIQ